MDSQALVSRPTSRKIFSSRRQIAQTEKLIADFERLIAELDRDVRAEEDRTGICDPTHFAYSTLAKASNQRRDNLKQSVNQLRIQLDEASSVADPLENALTAIWQESADRMLS